MYLNWCLFPKTFRERAFLSALADTQVMLPQEMMLLVFKSLCSDLTSIMLSL